MKTIVVGLGNPVLGDDGVGWRIVEDIQQELGASISTDVDFICLSVGGLSLMERLVGYKRAILIDAVNLGKLPVGSVYCLALTDLPDLSAGHTGSAHDTSLLTAIRLGREMGILLPEDILVIGVESLHVYEFSEKLSDQVANAIPCAVTILKRLLDDKEPAQGLIHADPGDLGRIKCPS